MGGSPSRRPVARGTVEAVVVAGGAERRIGFGGIRLGGLAAAATEKSRKEKPHHHPLRHPRRPETTRPPIPHGISSSRRRTSCSSPSRRNRTATSSPGS
jgi:hypothetical protein